MNLDYCTKKLNDVIYFMTLTKDLLITNRIITSETKLALTIAETICNHFEKKIHHKRHTPSPIYDKSKHNNHIYHKHKNEKKLEESESNNETSNNETSADDTSYHQQNSRKQTHFDKDVKKKSDSKKSKKCENKSESDKEETSEKEDTGEDINESDKKSTSEDTSEDDDRELNGLKKINCIKDFTSSINNIDVQKMIDDSKENFKKINNTDYKIE